MANARTNGWPGTREGLIDSIATAQALAWTATTEGEYLHWDGRRAELEEKAGKITDAEMDQITTLVAAKRKAYGDTGVGEAAA